MSDVRMNINASVKVVLNVTNLSYIMILCNLHLQAEIRQLWFKEYILSLCMDQDLLILLQMLNNVNWKLGYVRDDIRRGQSQHLRERDISYTICLVDFDVSQVLRLRGFLDVVRSVVRENGSITRSKVECPRVTVTDERCCTSMSFVEVKPLLRLPGTSHSVQQQLRSDDANSR